LYRERRPQVRFAAGRISTSAHGHARWHRRSLQLPEGSFTPRAATLDYLVGATATCLLGTLARALRVREINSDADHLSVDAVGEHESEDGVLVLRRIHIIAHLRAQASQRETAERVFQVFASKCPMHQSIRKAIDITLNWTSTNRRLTKRSTAELAFTPTTAFVRLVHDGDL